MRTLSILTAAALGLAANIGLAHAQATNFAPVSGTAQAYYGNGSDVPGPYSWRDGRAMNSRAIARSQRMQWYGGPGYYGPGRTEGIPPALYHAGDPQYWR